MYLPSTGMPPAHFEIFQSVAQELGLIVIVRNTNPRSTPWIARGYPPKPKSIQCHTSPKTGKVTAVNPVEIAACRAAGFYVINKDGIAIKGPNQALSVRFPFGTPEMNEEGQVIDPIRKKALVGDYDLMGVARPAAKGRNITLVSSNGIPVEDFTSPDVERVRTAVNKRLDQPRVMHGAQDHFADFPKGGSTAFLPNSLVWELKDEESVRAFYALMNRQTRAGTYSSSGK